MYLIALNPEGEFWIDIRENVDDHSGQHNFDIHS